MPSVSVKTLPVNTDNTGRRILGYIACLPESLDKMLSAYYKVRFASDSTPILDAFNKEGYLRTFLSDLGGDYVKRDTQDAGFSALPYANTEKYVVSEADEDSVSIDISGISVVHTLSGVGFQPLIAIGRSDVFEASVPVLAGVFGTETQLKFEDGTTAKNFGFPIIALPTFGINTGTQWSQGFGIGAAAASLSGTTIITVLPARRVTSIETMPNTNMNSVSSISGNITLTGRFYQEKETLLFEAEQPVMTPSAMQALPSFRQGVSQFSYESALGEETENYYRVVVQPNARCQVIIQPDNTVSEPVVIDNVLRVPRRTFLKPEGAPANEWTVIPVIRNASDNYPLVELHGSYQLGFSELRDELREEYPPTGDVNVIYVGGSAWDGWLNHKALTITKAGCKDIYTYSQQGLPCFAQEQLTSANGALEGAELLPFNKYVEWEGYELPPSDSEVFSLALTDSNLEREKNSEEAEPFVGQVFANEFLGNEIELYLFKLNYETPPAPPLAVPYCADSPNSIVIERDDVEVAGVIAGSQAFLESILGPLTNGDIIDGGGGMMLQVFFLPENADIAGWTVDWSTFVSNYTIGEDGFISHVFLDGDTFDQLANFGVEDIPTGREYYNTSNLVIQIVCVNSTGSFNNLVLEPIPASGVCDILGGTRVDEGGDSPVWTGDDHDEYPCSLEDSGCCGCDVPLDDTPISFNVNGVLATINRGTNITGVVNNLIDILTEELSYMVDSEDGVGLGNDLDMNAQRITNLAPAERLLDLVTLAQAQEVLNG